MGTSVNQRSPNTGGWRSVAACYTNENTSIDRAALEIWRAAVTQDDSILNQLGSDLVTKCATAATQGVKESTAIAEIERLSSLRENHLVGEFAKHALLIKAAGGHPNESFGAVLFRQITNYFISRDISGHVGSAHRCKTIEDLRAFKENVADVVAGKVQTVERAQHLKSRDWRQVYPLLLQHLRAS